MRTDLIASAAATPPGHGRLLTAAPAHRPPTAPIAGELTARYRLGGELQSKQGGSASARREPSHVVVRMAIEATTMMLSSFMSVPCSSPIA